jgi:hypothetical protein
MSLLPARVKLVLSLILQLNGPEISDMTVFRRSLVGWFGLQSDRQLAFKALDFTASKEGIHSVFAAIILMEYWSTVLALIGWMAEESKILERYKAILEPLVL